MGMLLFPSKLPHLSNLHISASGFAFDTEVKKWLQRKIIRGIECSWYRDRWYPCYLLVFTSWDMDHPTLKYTKYRKILPFFKEKTLYPLPDWPDFAISPDGELFNLRTLRFPYLNKSGSEKYIINKTSTSEARNISAGTTTAVTYVYWDVPEPIWKRGRFADKIKLLRRFQELKAIDFVRPLPITDSRGNAYYAGRDGHIYNSTSGNKIQGGKCWGYRVVNLNYEYWRTHRLVALAFCEIPEDLKAQGYTHDQLSVNHIDGNRENNLPSNLEWCTIEQNTRHAIETGCIQNRCMSLQDIEKIKQLHRAGKTVSKIAWIMGVSTSVVRYHLNRKRGAGRRLSYRAFRANPAHTPTIEATPCTATQSPMTMEGDSHVSNRSECVQTNGGQVG